MSQDFGGLAHGFYRLGFPSAFVERAANELDRLVDVEGLGKIFVGAALEGGHRGIEIRIGGHHDDRHRGMALLDGLQQLQPRAPGHADIGDEALRRTARERIERLLRGGKRVEGDAFAAERLFDHPADGTIVVDDPDRFHVSGSRILNMVRPGRDSNSTTPWWYWTNVCASESPKPVPPSLPDTSGLKIRSWISAATPGPSSTTCNSNASLWRCRRMVICRTARVRKLMRWVPCCSALLAMLSTAWISCSRSPTISGMLGS